MQFNFPPDPRVPRATKLLAFFIDPEELSVLPISNVESPFLSAWIGPVTSVLAARLVSTALKISRKILVCRPADRVKAGVFVNGTIPAGDARISSIGEVLDEA